LVEVNLYGTLRMVAGRKNAPVDLPEGAVLGDLIHAVVRSFPAIRSVLLDESGRLRSDVPVFLNGRNPRLQRNYEQMIVNPGDVLSLFSPVSSGRINVEALRGDPLKRQEG